VNLTSEPRSPMRMARDRRPDPTFSRESNGDSDPGRNRLSRETVVR
jgi:hypothetical protein